MLDSQFRDSENYDPSDSYNRWREQLRSPSSWAVVGAAILVVFVLCGIVMINYDNSPKLDAKGAAPSTLGQGTR
jgi:hypothetical protein